MSEWLLITLLCLPSVAIVVASYYVWRLQEKMFDAWEAEAQIEIAKMRAEDAAKGADHAD